MIFSLGKIKPPVEEQWTDGVESIALTDEVNEDDVLELPPRKHSPDVSARFGASIRSALGPGTVIEGKFSFDTPVRIDGTLVGEVYSSSALIVGAQATVNALITVGSLVVLGSVTGEVDAKELVEIKAGGVLEGDITTKRLVVEEGAIYQGKISMREGQ